MGGGGDAFLVTIEAVKASSFFFFNLHHTVSSDPGLRSSPKAWKQQFWSKSNERVHMCPTKAVSPWTGQHVLLTTNVNIAVPLADLQLLKLEQFMKKHLGVVTARAAVAA